MIPECEDDLTFVEDITVPDDSVYAPGDIIEKVWLVENSGTCNWDEDYSVRLIEGPPMGAERRQALFPARSGSEAQITILFTAPNREGQIISKWQAFNPEGEPFGQIFFIQVIINPEATPTATPSNN